MTAPSIISARPSVSLLSVEPNSASCEPLAVRGSAGVAAYLRQAILDGAYEFGDRLPAERQLAKSLSCSRATLRDALGHLQQSGFVTRRHGSGTFVSYRSKIDEYGVAEITSPLQLVEVRVALEPDMVRLATVNGTAREINRMGDILTALERSDDDASHFSAWDQHFHQALADATKNPLMISLYQQINEVRGHAQWNNMKGKILSAERIAGYNHQHRALFNAIAGRQVETAAQIIRDHLEDARRDLLAI